MVAGEELLLEKPGAVLLEQGLGEGLGRLGSSSEPGKELGEAGGIGSPGVRRGHAIEDKGGEPIFRGTGLRAN